MHHQAFVITLPDWHDALSHTLSASERLDFYRKSFFLNTIIDEFRERRAILGARSCMESPVGPMP
ncbi:hypothetical protein, partial [Sphingomonas sp. GC_Shp_2]|uniref:hypothetical protein n=1 Tax=Sphingomonas sp. GC_Shp_2 TaxID=2937384 RepID=UPI00226AF9E8